jgi:glutamyl-tRNA reductase
MFFIDIAVPRDIAPAINALDNVYLYDIDDLQHVVQENLKARHREAALGEAMIAREVEEVLRWLDEQAVVPAEIGLRRKAEAIRKQELAKLFAKHGAFSEVERDAIAAHGIVDHQQAAARAHRPAQAGLPSQGRLTPSPGPAGAVQPRR